jgi:uncharacterized protein
MIVGRAAEIKLLEGMWRSNKAEFCALYGRRRIGKTFLVRELFEKKKGSLYFEVTGMKDGSLKGQLKHFASKLSKTFYKGISITPSHSWEDAFGSLNEAILNTKYKKVVVFLDELPWLATKRSGLIQALDYFWNTEWVKNKKIKLIACGSAASWILNNLINAKGGLHNRLTQVVLLEPFNLKTAKEFLSKQGIRLSNKQLLDIYMIIGGIPFYLEQLKKSKSVSQNINSLCFSKNGLLKEEFSRLFKSLFKNSRLHLKLIKEIAKKRYGISREELLKNIGEISSGWINEKLNELVAAGFIKSFTPYGKIKKPCYKIIDEYSLFYLRWIKPELSSGHDFAKNHWHIKSKTPSWTAWAGYAFESVCEKHLEQIRVALEIDKIDSPAHNWKYAPLQHSKESGAQIDLLFDRDDSAITLCEIKYSNEKFVINKDYARVLANKVDVFEAETKTKKQILFALITTIGVKANLYSEDQIDSVVMLDDLFK